MIYLFYIKSMQQQVGLGISCMNGRPTRIFRISYSCLISHCGFYDIFILWQELWGSNWAQESAEWMESFTHVWSAIVVSMIYFFYGKSYGAATEPRNQLNEWKAHASLTHVWSATVVSMIYLFYCKGYAAATEPKNQLNEWKAQAPFTHVW